MYDALDAMQNMLEHAPAEFRLAALKSQLPHVAAAVEAASEWPNGLCHLGSRELRLALIAAGSASPDQMGTTEGLTGGGVAQLCGRDNEAASQLAAKAVEYTEQLLLHLDSISGWEQLAVALQNVDDILERRRLTPEICEIVANWHLGSSGVAARYLEVFDALPDDNAGFFAVADQAIGLVETLPSAAMLQHLTGRDRHVWTAMRRVSGSSSRSILSLMEAASVEWWDGARQQAISDPAWALLVAGWDQADVTDHTVASVPFEAVLALCWAPFATRLLPKLVGRVIDESASLLVSVRSDLQEAALDECIGCDSDRGRASKRACAVIRYVLHSGLHKDVAARWAHLASEQEPALCVRFADRHDPDLLDVGRWFGMGAYITSKPWAAAAAGVAFGSSCAGNIDAWRLAIALAGSWDGTLGELGEVAAAACRFAT